MKKNSKPFEQLLHHKASTNDFTTLIKDDHFTSTDKGPILYMKMDSYLVKEEINEIIQLLQRVKFSSRKRTAGKITIRNESIGWKPAHARNLDACEMAALATNHPLLHDKLIDLGAQLASIFKNAFPEKYEECEVLIRQSGIQDQYKIVGGFYTSGVVNKTDAIVYHHDNDNLDGVLSCMIVFKHQVAGGYLAIPELDIAFEMSNNTILIFDGKQLMHGVTNITELSPRAYRYSIVFYVRKGMRKAGSQEEELKRLRQSNAGRDKRAIAKAGERIKAAKDVLPEKHEEGDEA